MLNQIVNIKNYTYCLSKCKMYIIFISPAIHNNIISVWGYCDLYKDNYIIDRINNIVKLDKPLEFNSDKTISIKDLMPNTITQPYRCMKCDALKGVCNCNDIYYSSNNCNGVCIYPDCHC